MPNIDINFDDLTDPYEPAPRGTYTLRVIADEFTESKSGNEMAHITLEIADGDYAGKQLHDYVTFIPDNQFGLWRFKQYCDLAGADADDYEGGELTGIEFEGEVIIDPGDEEYGPSNRLRRVFTE